MEIKINGNEISEYVGAVINGVEKGIPKGFALSSPVKFQIGLTNVSDKEGNLTLMIAGVGGTHRKEENTRIEFEVDDALDVIGRRFTDIQNAPLFKHMYEMEEEKNRQLMLMVRDIVANELDKIKGTDSHS